ncbi:MAG: M20/M25/M40 family metallo-hydrolase [Clostridia bacterium]|nr:M20/M25/M40 family metallo-hydrolase [Clostridia bacterium]
MQNQQKIAWELLDTLLETPSVSGCEEPNQRHAIRHGKTFADKVTTDTMGNVISILQPEAPFRVLLCGHMDEIGFRVTHIDDKGMIHVQRAGGVNPKLYVGAPMQISHVTYEDGKARIQTVTAVGAVVSESLKKERMEDKDLILDIGADTKEEAQAVVSVGDPVCADTKVVSLLGDRISCRALDDKSGAFTVMEAARLAGGMGLSDQVGVWCATTVGEETTGRGAYQAAAQVKPDCAVIVDVTWASDCPGTDPAETGDIRVGGGPVLCMSGMVNKTLNRKMEEAARKSGIPLQYEVAGGRTHTDGDTVTSSGIGVPCVLVSIPLRYMHSSVEVASRRDIEQCIRLIAAFLKELSGNETLSPLAEEI